nr:enhanced intracellular survival protein Eis [Mycobacterium spongiae]
MNEPAVLPGSLRLRPATEADLPAMMHLGATSFGDFGELDEFTAWRDLRPTDNAVVVVDGCDEGCEDGADIVGMALYFDLRLTVPGGAVLPTAGLSWVAVAPTHRRRGLLSAMCAELHRRIADSGYPLAALHASEGAIYGRFGYGPATILHELTVDRRFARFHADVPSPGGVRLVKPGEHRDDFAEIYERWRQQTPGGLLRPVALWDDLLADRESSRYGGTAWFAFLHPDGYALYRVHGIDHKVVRGGELRAATADAHIALWRALLGLDLMEKITMFTSVADPLPYQLTDARLAQTTRHQDGLWLRIVDVPRALEARSYPAELCTVLEVSDGPGADGGRYALEIRDGRARCTPTEASAEITMDRGVLGSLYLGAHRASAWAAANRLQAKDAGLIRRLDAAFDSDIAAEAGFEF